MDNEESRYQRNKEKLKEYYINHKEEILKKRKENYRKNKPIILKRCNDYYKRNKYKILKRNRKYTEKYNKTHKEYFRKKSLESYYKNKPKVMLRQKTRRNIEKDNACSLCGSIDNLQFHHKTYNDINASTVCRDCHYDLHMDGGLNQS